jgi:hypothetical protein
MFKKKWKKKLGHWKKFNKKLAYEKKNDLVLLLAQAWTEGKENLPSQGGSTFQSRVLKKLEKVPLVSPTLTSPLQILYHSLIDPHLQVDLNPKP